MIEDGNLELIMGDCIGHGSFGIVYLAELRGMLVAVKELHTFSDESRSEYLRAYELLQQLLKHPNITLVYGHSINQSENCLLTVMEYMSGGSLYSLLCSSEALAWMRRYQIALDITRGLTYLHHHNILYRDLKSRNVLLDGRGRAKLCNFDLAIHVPSSKSISSGTRDRAVPWMAPELFRMHAIFTRKSDVYSLGITLWELVTRKLPLKAIPGIEQTIPYHVIKGHRDEIPCDCPPALASLISRCWDGDPLNRPSTDTVLEELTAMYQRSSEEVAEARTVLQHCHGRLVLLGTNILDAGTREEISQAAVEALALLVRMRGLQDLSEESVDFFVQLLETVACLSTSNRDVVWERVLSGWNPSVIVSWTRAHIHNSRAAALGCDILTLFLSHHPPVTAPVTTARPRYWELATELLRSHEQEPVVLASVLALMIAVGCDDQLSEGVPELEDCELLVQMLIVQLLQQRRRRVS